jgi:UDP-N-acetylglucosamine:LPS N-acetylglucosamine transferase
MKVLAIASAGGHWTQLLRIVPVLATHELIFVSTNKNFCETVKGSKFYTVPDANRWNNIKLIYMSCHILKIILTVKPQVIISTGAAPGLIGIIAGKLTGAKTIWVDSIANIEHISLSGKIALRFADRFYTQWQHLATATIFYNGNVLQ